MMHLNPRIGTTISLIKGGSTREVLAFRVGDIYTLTEEGANPPLNMRAEPSKSAGVVDQLGLDVYLRVN